MYIVNLYIPPASSRDALFEQNMGEDVHNILGDAPINEHTIVLSDLNAHLRANVDIVKQTYPCGECKRILLTGNTDRRGL